MAGPDYRIEAVVSAPFDQVAYVVWRQGRDDAIIVDPGFDTDAIQQVLDHHGLRPAAILNTHGHADHIAGNGAIKAAYPEAPLMIGRHEAALLTDPDKNLSGPFGLPLVSPPADRLIDEGERLDLAGLSFLALEIPGHSPGSLVFVCDQYDPPFALGGDVLFAGSVGRTDFPGGSSQSLLSGIRTKLFSLPEGTIVFPGHGTPTTVGAERRNNPFVGENSGVYRLD